MPITIDIFYTIHSLHHQSYINNLPRQQNMSKRTCLDNGLGRRNLLIVDIMPAVGVYLLLDLVDVDVCQVGVGAVEDAANLLEGGALGLDVDKVDEDELDEVPKLSDSPLA
jgi:hypothetical protein